MVTRADGLIERGKSDSCRFPGLTLRERAVLRLAAEGHTNIQIAAKLHISKYTVAQHIAKMLRTTGASNRTDLVHRAHRAGILTVDDQSSAAAAMF